MAKHVIEEQLLDKAGFVLVTNGEVDILSDNAGRVLALQADDTIDIDIKNNKVHFSVRTPVFQTLEW